MNKKTVILTSIAVLIIGFIWVYNSKNAEEEMAAAPMPAPEMPDTASLPPPPEAPAAAPELPAAPPAAPEPPPAAANPSPDEVNKMAGLGASSSGRSR